jgi:endonuclease-3
LPGVGRKTANVFLNSAFDEPFIGVDTHILRISNRIGFSKGTNPEKVEEDLAKIVPKEYQKSAGHQLVLHGRYVCKAKKPECYRCPIVKYCEYKAKNL